MDNNFDQKPSLPRPKYTFSPSPYRPWLKQPPQNTPPSSTIKQERGFFFNNNYNYDFAANRKQSGFRPYAAPLVLDPRRKLVSYSDLEFSASDPELKPRNSSVNQQPVQNQKQKTSNVFISIPKKEPIFLGENVLKQNNTAKELGWSAQKDRYGETFYYNSTTKQTQWEPPASCPSFSINKPFNIQQKGFTQKLPEKSQKDQPVNKNEKDKQTIQSNNQPLPQKPKILVDKAVHQLSDFDKRTQASTVVRVITNNDADSSRDDNWDLVNRLKVEYGIRLSNSSTTAQQNQSEDENGSREDLTKTPSADLESNKEEGGEKREKEKPTQNAYPSSIEIEKVKNLKNLIINDDKPQLNQPNSERISSLATGSNIPSAIKTTLVTTNPAQDNRKVLNLSSQCTKASSLSLQCKNTCQNDLTQTNNTKPQSSTAIWTGQISSEAQARELLQQPKMQFRRVSDNELLLKSHPKSNDPPLRAKSSENRTESHTSKEILHRKKQSKNDDFVEIIEQSEQNEKTISNSSPKKDQKTTKSTKQLDQLRIDMNFDSPIKTRRARQILENRNTPREAEDAEDRDSTTSSDLNGPRTKKKENKKVQRKKRNVKIPETYNENLTENTPEEGSYINRRLLKAKDNMLSPASLPIANKCSILSPHSSSFTQRSITIGPEHQAEIPPASSPQKPNNRDEEECWWRPLPEEDKNAIMENLDQYLDVADRHQGLPIDEAMKLLFENDLSMENALKKLETVTSKRNKNWTDEQLNTFLALFDKHKKKFNLISRNHPQELSVNDLVDQYYHSKKRRCMYSPFPNVICPHVHVLDPSIKASTIKRENCENCRQNLYKKPITTILSARSNKQKNLCPPCELYLKLTGKHRPFVVPLPKSTNTKTNNTAQNSQHQIPPPIHREEYCIFVPKQPKTPKPWIENEIKLIIEGFLKHGRNHPKILKELGRGTMRNVEDISRFYEQFAQKYSLENIIELHEEIVSKSKEGSAEKDIPSAESSNMTLRQRKCKK